MDRGALQSLGSQRVGHDYTHIAHQFISYEICSIFTQSTFQLDGISVDRLIRGTASNFRTSCQIFFLDPRGLMSKQNINVTRHRGDSERCDPTTNSIRSSFYQHRLLKRKCVSSKFLRTKSLSLFNDKAVVNKGQHIIKGKGMRSMTFGPCHAQVDAGSGLSQVITSDLKLQLPL